MAIVGVITARGGSRGISKKSIALCAGQPLLSYTCASALSSQSLDRVILSTDDDEIADVGRSCGVDVPFFRPPELATDTSLMPEVLAHAADWLTDHGVHVNGLVLLQPTSPLREARHIDEAVALFNERSADTVVSLVEVPHQFNPVSVMTLDPAGRVAPYAQNAQPIMRRQDKPAVHARNGPAVLVVRPNVVKRGELYGEQTFGYVMDKLSSVDIDDAEDLELAGLLLRERRICEAGQASS